MAILNTCILLKVQDQNSLGRTVFAADHPVPIKTAYYSSRGHRSPHTKISPGSYILFLLDYMLDLHVWIKRNFFHSHPLLTGASCWPDSGCFLFCLSVSFWQLLQTRCPSWPHILSFSILMIIARCKTFDLLLPCWAKTVWMLNAGQGQTLPLLGQKASGINFKTILQNFKIPQYSFKICLFQLWKPNLFDG